MKFLILVGLLELAAAQIDPSDLAKIFGIPAVPVTQRPPESTTVKPIDHPTKFVDTDSEPCQCVPSHLCDDNHVGIHVKNASITGWGVIDIRFGEDDSTVKRKCREGETCCTSPKDPTGEPKPPRPRQTTVKPTEHPPTLVGTDGQPCQCVPSHLCDDNHVGENVNNASLTEWDLINLRFGEDNSTVKRKCREGETCCTSPKDPTGEPKPPRPRQTTVKPIDHPTTFVDTDGQPCQCVPSHLCDDNHVGENVNNASLTEWDLINLRFGEDNSTVKRKCREGETCCTSPKDPTGEPKPPRPRQTTVKPIDHTTTFVDTDGQPCECVSSHLCDDNHVGENANNASITEWDLINLRFGEDDSTVKRQCREGEICCTIPKDPTGEPKPPRPKPTPIPVNSCGYRNPRGLGVTNTGGTGAEAQFGEFPWVVALLDNQNDTYVGVGVLIHPQVVMTVAHIAQRFGPRGLKIRAGEWDFKTVKEIFPHEERLVETTVIHENFNPKIINNDIALLRLDLPLDMSEYINVICMPDYDEVFDSRKNCVANGWGKTHFGKLDAYAALLKKVQIDMVPKSRCNTLLKRTRLGSSFKLHKSFICAGGEAGKDTCQGDGGAPLACPIGNNRYKLSGLVAWGIGCGHKDVPGVYTNVPLFRQWVDDKMADWGLAATSY